ncbi:MAG: hypothetical protein AAFZ07_05475 [Actinomycetota bacterium]
MNVDDRIRTTLDAQLRAEEARLANGMVGSTGRSRGHRGPMLLATAAVVGLVGIAAVVLWANRSTGSGDDLVVAVTPTTSAPVTTVAPPTTAPATTVPVTTEGPVTPEVPGPTTEVPGQSVPPGPTVVPDTSVPDTSVPDTSPPPTGPATAIGRVDVDDGLATRIVEVDVATGQVLRDLATIDLEASGIGRLQVTPDRQAVYFTQGWEDSWFSCESSLPVIQFVDASGGPSEPVAVGNGASPRLSPDGSRLAYLAASRCVPDPQNPANWVLTPLDTVVVRDLATGSEQRWTDTELAGLDAATLSYELLIETELRGLAWLGDDELVVPGHRFRAADLERTGDAAQFFGTEPFGSVVVGWDAASGAVLVEEVVRDDAGETTGANLVAVDPISGGRSVVATTPAGPWVFWGAFAVDDSGTAILNRGPGGLGLPDGSAVALGVELVGIDW